MNKITIDIWFPNIDYTINTKIPINKPIGIIFNEILDKSDNEILKYYKDNKKIILFDKESGYSIDINMIVNDSVLRNGSTLIAL